MLMVPFCPFETPDRLPYLTNALVESAALLYVGNTGDTLTAETP
jgi:hypothetical protein